MERKKPKPQTIASQKYQEKIGMMSKAYKLSRKDVEEFASACDKAGISQAKQLTKMMREFIKQVNEE